MKFLAAIGVIGIAIGLAIAVSVAFRRSHFSSERNDKSLMAKLSDEEVKLLKFSGISFLFGTVLIVVAGYFLNR